MDVSKLTANAPSLELGQTVASGISTKAGGGTHSALVERSEGGYYAYVVPSLPGAGATGSSVSAAEANLSLILDVLA